MFNPPPKRPSRGTPSHLCLQKKATPTSAVVPQTTKGRRSARCLGRGRRLRQTFQSTSVCFGSLKRKSAHQILKRSLPRPRKTCALIPSLFPTRFGCREIGRRVPPDCADFLVSF